MTVPARARGISSESGASRYKLSSSSAVTGGGGVGFTKARFTVATAGPVWAAPAANDDVADDGKSARSTRSSSTGK